MLLAQASEVEVLTLPIEDRSRRARLRDSSVVPLDAWLSRSWTQLISGGKAATDVTDTISAVGCSR